MKNPILYTNNICPFAQRAFMSLLECKVDYETRLVPLMGEISRAENMGIKNVIQYKDANLD